jgi:large subunit ribosomal protein L25
MEEIILDAEIRSDTGKNKANALRHKGIIPAVVYGEGKAGLAISVFRGQFLKTIHQHHVENAIITLKIKDDKKKGSRACMMREIQHDPVKGEVLHIDFNEISLTKAIKVKVPVEPRGEAVGVKQDGGSLEHILWEVEIECLPTEIPHKFEVDVSTLKIGDSIHVKDIAFPSTVKVITEMDAIVLSIAAPMKEEVAAVAEGEEKVEPEVLKEKKPEAAEGAAAEGKEKDKEKDKDKK